MTAPDPRTLLTMLNSWLASTAVAIFRRPLEVSSTFYQMESLGVESMGIASVTSLFVGMVMAVQFAFGLQKFGGMEYTGRIIGISFSRELAPTLTAVIVGGRIGAGIAAEVGSMAVTEQIDAIRALGADPVKKLVVPRLLASVVVMPVLGAFVLWWVAFLLGSLVIELLLGYRSGIGRLVGFVYGAVAATVLYPLPAILYVLLREEKEGATIEQITAALD